MLTLGGNPFTLSDGTDIAVRANGTFYVVSLSSETDLYTLDVGTGALTLVFSDSALQDGFVPYFAGITFSSAASSPSHLFGYEVDGSDNISATTSMQAPGHARCSMRILSPLF